MRESLRARTDAGDDVLVQADDAELIRRYAESGDQDAFAVLVRRYADVVYAACRRRLHDPAGADDAAQATFLVLERRARSLARAQPPIGAWLLRTARLTCATHQRERRRRHAHERAAVAAQVKDVACAHEAHELEEALDRLPSRYREALLMRYALGKSREQIAAELGIGVDVARRRLAQGLALLRARLGLPDSDAASASALLVLLQPLAAPPMRAAPSARALALAKQATAAQTTTAFAVVAAVAAPLVAALAAVVVVAMAHARPVLAAPAMDAHAHATWSPTGSLTTARSLHTAITLDSGKILVIGGSVDGRYTLTCELYDPAAGTWQRTGAMRVARSGATATRLASGRILVAGGIGDTNACLSSCELYDPDTGTWSATGALATPRVSAAAVALPGGRVLVSGGRDDAAYLASCEIYDPIAGAWTATDAMAAARAVHTATLLPTGQILVTGGFAGAGTPGAHGNCELYDPASRRWSRAGDLAVPRHSHQAVVLPTGRVLVVGGSPTSGAPRQAATACELYDPLARTWTSTGSLARGRVQPAVALLPDGSVIALGGSGSDVAGSLGATEIYDPASGRWSPGTPLPTARMGMSVSVLPSRRLLVAGGHVDAPVAICELLAP